MEVATQRQNSPETAVQSPWPRTPVTISVLIPVCNGAATLPVLLKELCCQTCFPYEILVVDSASEDDSVAIAREFGAKVRCIAREDFDHAGTRTIMAKEAQGDILVFLTQDAIPVGNTALAALFAPLLAEDDVAAAYGRQIAAATASFSARHLRGFNYPAQSQIRTFADRQYLGFATIFLSNSFAAFRRDALQEVGFFGEDMIFGEDSCVAARLLQQGYRIAYQSEAMVVHSHEYSWWQELQRSFDIGVFHARESWLLSTFGRPEGRGRLYLLSELKGLLLAGKIGILASFLSRNGAKIVGYLLGRRHRLLPGRCCQFFSMNTNWWRRHRG